MGFIGDTLGSVVGGITGGIADGLVDANGYQASGLGNVKQVETAYDQTQDSLKQQQAFINALQGQNGIQNQSDVYNQLQGMANGTGPNPALAQLNQQTSNNVANQAALIAGQRGASQNVGLIGRQAAMQGSNAQQQAIGQGATLQAQQQANAINNMGNLATTQVGQQANAQQAYGSQALQQQANLFGAQAKANEINSGISSGNTKSHNDASMGVLSGAMGGLSMLSDNRQKQDVKPADGQIEDFLGNMNAHEYEYKNPQLPGAGQGKHVSPMAQELEQSELGAQMVQDTPNGKMVDYGKGFGTILAAQAELHKRLEALEGGGKSSKKQKMSDGGMAMPPPPDQNQIAQQQAALNAFNPQMRSSGSALPSGMDADPIAVPSYIKDQTQNQPKSGFAQYMQDKQAAASSGKSEEFNGGKAVGEMLTGGVAKGMGGLGSLMSLFGSGGGGAEAVAGGGAAAAGGGGSLGALALLANKGAYVPGKPKTGGDSPKNDTVEAKLSPGEIVLPRSVVNSKHPEKAAAEFVAAILARHNPQAPKSTSTASDKKRKSK